MAVPGGAQVTEIVDATPQPQAAPQQMAEFNVRLASGAVAIVMLPVGMSALDMLSLIAQMPAIGSQASMAGRNALDRILLPNHVMRP